MVELADPAWRPDIERFDDRPGHADDKVTVSERTVLVERLIKAEHRAALAERALRERHPDSAAYITALQAQLAAAERNVDMLLKERAARAA